MGQTLVRNIWRAAPVLPLLALALGAWPAFTLQAERWDELPGQKAEKLCANILAMQDHHERSVALSRSDEYVVVLRCADTELRMLTYALAGGPSRGPAANASIPETEIKKVCPAYFERFAHPCHPRNPNEYWALMRSSFAAFKDGNAQEAAADLERAIKVDPKFGQALLYRGYLHYLEKHYRQAGQLFRSAARWSLEPRKVFQLVDSWTSRHASIEHETQFKTGFAAIEARKFKEARDIFAKLVEAAPNNYTYHYELGYVEVELHLFKEAEVRFRKALEINPVSKKALAEMRFILAELGKTDELKKTVTEMRTLYGDAPEYRHELALTLLRKSDTKDSIAMLEENVGIFPKFAESRMVLGRLYFQNKDCARATIHLKAFLELYDHGRALKDPRASPEEIVGSAKKMLSACSVSV